MINDPSQNKKPLIFYMAVAVIVIILLNAFVFPMLLQRQVQEVGYSAAECVRFSDAFAAPGSGSRLQRFSENGGFKTGIRSIHG